MAWSKPNQQDHIMKHIPAQTTIIIRLSPPCILSHQLRPYIVNTIAEWIQCDPTPPVIHDGVKEYKVEHILDSQIFRGKLKYLVWWKGYGIEEDKWRPSEDVKVKRLVSEFHRQNPEAPQHISAIDFSELPFCPLTNFIDTPDTVPLDWATSLCMLSCHAFEEGVNVRVCSI